MGGDHKCPLCSATFTRPQHVGRHLRAHTGDRPYECKECPLRFARSDLLSRHVNKAHPKPNGAPGSNKHEKKGRSKSLSSATVSAPIRPPPMAPNPLRAVPQPPEPTAYQAQRMYPNHPLLQQNHNIAWGTCPLDLTRGGMGGMSHYNNNNMGLGGPTGHLGSDVMGSFGNATAPGMASINPFGGHPITYAASDTCLPTSAYDLATSLPNLGSTTLGYELNTKKRACDQCNHSKVRCDFADPCARCSHRHVQCTYTKPQRTTRTRNVTYPIPRAHVTTSPSQRTQSLHQSPTTVFGSMGDLTMAQLENDPLGMDRRSSEQSTASSDFMDPLRAGDRVLPPVPDPQWHNGTHLHPRSQSMSTVESSSLGNGSLISQSPNSTLGLTLTPTLTSEPSPSTSDDTTDRRGMQNAMTNNPNWALPPSVLSQKSAMNFANNFVAQQSGNEPNVFHGNPQFAWPNHHGGIDTSMLPADSALSMSEDGASPESMMDEDAFRRRRSNASVWANALKEMRLDDSSGPTLSIDPSLGLELLPFHMSHGPFKDDSSNSSIERNVSNSELNLWKLFLDPGVLPTPGKMNPFDFNNDTPRALNKSNSAPDLTTPMTASNFPNPFEAFSEKMDADGEGAIKVEKPRKAASQDDEETLGRWKDHISMRHASFSMDPSAEATVRTRALTNATFASSIERQLRPSLRPLVQPSAGDKTLAPERLPSFGPTAFDSNQVLLTPNLRGDPRTPTRLVNKFTAIEARPSNKRQASQTLTGDMQKRGTILVWPDEDETGSSQASSRRGSGPSGTHSLPAALHKTGRAPHHNRGQAWQAADAPRAC